MSWLLGNAEQLPVDDNSVDLYTVAFGIRNMTHIDQVRMHNRKLTFVLFCFGSFVRCHS